MTETHPQNRRLGSARVSTYGQTLDAQLEQLRSAGCTKVYRERVTGAHSDRRELLKLLKSLAAGDTVTVTRRDRLARGTFDLFGIVKSIVGAKAQFRSLAEPWVGGLIEARHVNPDDTQQEIACAAGVSRASTPATAANNPWPPAPPPVRCTPDPQAAHLREAHVFFRAPPMRRAASPATGQ